MNNLCSIYKVTNKTNGKIYIGQTWLTLRKRWRFHSNDKSGCIKLRTAIKKYGINSFSINLITLCGTQESADYWEDYFIKHYDAIKNGYNIKEGGSRGKWSEESKMKLSKSNMGHLVSNETRKKLSVSHSGKEFSEKHKQNISRSHMGKIHTQETKEKMRGENNARAKLNKDQINEIINLYSTGNYSSRQLAKKFGIGKTQILRIINKKSWVNI